MRASFYVSLCLGFFGFVFGSGVMASELAESSVKQRVMLSDLRAALEFKRDLSDSERKLGTHLASEAKARRDEQGLSVTPSASRDQERFAGLGIYTVAGAMTPSLKHTITMLGGTVRSESSVASRLTIDLPKHALIDLASHIDVSSIRPVTRAIPQQVTTAGAIAHRVDQLDPTRTGTGIRIGVINEPIDPADLLALITNGDLPEDVDNQLYLLDWTNPDAAQRTSQSGSWGGGNSGAWASEEGTNEGLAML